MELYKKTYSTSDEWNSLTDSLYKKYRVTPGWLVLKGYHHHLLREHLQGKYSEIQPFHRSGLVDLRTSQRQKVEIPGIGEKAWHYLQNSILSDDPRFMYLRIDASYPTKIIMNALRKRINQQKTEIEKTPDDSEWFQTQYIEPKNNKKGFAGIFRRSKTVIQFDVPRWIDYFTCYDLRHGAGKTYGQIAGKVYGDSKSKYENAEIAVKRVTKLIHYTVTENWPPPKNFLNKKLPSSPASK